MSTALKVIIMLVAWFVYSLIVYQSCISDYYGAGEAGETAVAGEVGEAGANVPIPIGFRYGEAEPVQGPGYDQLRRRLVRQADDDRILEITGLYFESEPKPDNYDSYGFARAEAVKGLFAPDIAADAIRVRARTLAEDSTSRNALFSGVEFNWVEAEDPEAPAQEQAEVEELADRIIVRFPYNSTQRTLDPAIEQYLDQLAERLKQNNETVTITGHTDNTGTDEYNQQLGLQRANALKDVLVRKGVPAARISVDSKGKTQPVESNDSEAGRQNNRRAELRLVPEG